MSCEIDPDAIKIKQHRDTVFSTSIGDKTISISKTPRVWEYETKSERGWEDLKTGKKYKEKPLDLPEHFYYALLAVPKGSPEGEPSINKYAPVIAQAGSLNELKEELAKWHKETCHKTSWELRE